MVNGADISPDKARKMRAWFARQSQTRRDRDSIPVKTYHQLDVAWALWGGDPAVSWSNKLVNQMDRRIRST